SLLHIDLAQDHMDWDTWLAAQGHAGLRPAGSIRFDTYEQMIQAAVGAQGIAMGIGRLVRALMASGLLVAPFGESTVGSRAYFIICSAQTRERPHVRAFVDWLVAEAKAALQAEDAASPGMPKARRRSASSP